MSFSTSWGPNPPDGSSRSLTTSSRIIVVGAGAFGLSTALHLLRRGYSDVTVLDRGRELPAVDAASTDINKIVRSCYSDIFYTNLAREAIEAWKEPLWEGCYHECGVVSVGADKFNIKLKENDQQLGAYIEDLPDSKAIQTQLLSFLRSTIPVHPDSGLNAHSVGTFTNYNGYFNSAGGWVEAARAIKILLLRVRELGGRVIDNQEIIGLLRDRNGWTTGVKCKNGQCFEGDKVILTIGSWTASTFPELRLDSNCLATGHSVAMIQLSAKEKERYNKCPIYLDFESGFCTFPPTDDGIVKLSIHAAGCTHTISPKHVNTVDPVRKISTPRTITSHPDSGDGLRVPRATLQLLRTQLRKVYPELAEKSWAGTRMCWYTDAPDGNWVIGPYPGDPTLFLATSGSEHAFKFLPNIGRLIVDSLEDKLDSETATWFMVERDVTGAKNGERASHVTYELDVAELCGPDDQGAVTF